jgi:hypothetical protein
MRQAFATLSDPYLKGDPVGFIVLIFPFSARFTKVYEIHGWEEA